MLIIKAPISLTCRTDMTVSGEAFAERINGNYMAMTASISSEDLMHMVTTPPEILFADGQETTIFNQSSYTMNQNTKVEIINQLANRILLSGQANFTYQDQVYITNILHKLGISDVNFFMRQVSQIKQETQNTTNLIDLYWNHLEELQQMVEDYHNQSDYQTINEKSQNNASPLYLHESIMNRLQTGAIYQLLQNFQDNNGILPEQISNQELLLSEQHRVTQNILLNKLENTVRGEKQPLIFRHENFYEETLLQETSLNEEQISKQLTSAVLLQMIDNVFQTRLSRQREQGDSWYHFETSMYQTAENTMKRISSKLTENTHNETLGDTYIENVNKSYQQEISMINRMLETQELNQEHQTNQILTQEFINQSKQEKKETTEVLQQKLQLTQNEQNEWIENSQNQTVITSSESENIEQMEQQLQEINRVNVENRNRYLQNLQKLQEQERHPAKESMAERMRKESLQALENPQELLLTYQEEAAFQKEEKKGQEKQILEALPPESRQIYELLEQYTKTPERMQESSLIVKNDLGLLMHDIEEVQSQKQTEELTYYQNDNVIREVTENVIEKWQEKVVEPKNKSSKIPGESPKISLVHKQAQNPLEDEVVEQLIEQNKQLKNTTKSTEEIVENKQNTSTKIINQAGSTVVQETEDITEMIERGVQRQIGEISDQIMGKLEKKLVNERKRRGF